jgi:hypothetical protein
MVRFVKGLFSGNTATGNFVGEEADPGGKNGIRLGDGYHNYLLAGFVSCNHNGMIPADRQVLGAQLVLRSSRIFGSDPFLIKTANSTVANAVVIQTDLVSPRRPPLLWLRLPLACRVDFAPTCHACTSSRALRCPDQPVNLVCAVPVAVPVTTLHLCCMARTLPLEASPLWKRQTGR